MATTHPTRTAPLCGNCKHMQPVRVTPSVTTSMCNHPAAPRDLVFGAPTLSCVNARAGEVCGVVHRMDAAQPQPVRLPALCGVAGLFFEATP